MCSTSVCPGTSGPTWAPPLLSAPQLLGPRSSEGQACCWGVARAQSCWLRLPLFGFSELLRLMKGFVLPRQGGFFTGSLLSVGAWTETGLLAQGLVSGQRERRGELRLPSDRRGGLLPSNRCSQREGQGSRHPRFLRTGCRLLWVLRAAGQSHTLWGSPRVSCLSLPLS